MGSTCTSHFIVYPQETSREFSQFCGPTFKWLILEGLLDSLLVFEGKYISIVINNKYRTLAGRWDGTHILTTLHRTAFLSLTICHSLHKYIFIYFGYWLYLFNIMVASPTGMSIKLIVTLPKSNPTTSRFLSVFVIDKIVGS